MGKHKNEEERLREYIADGVNELLDGKRKKKRKSDFRFYGEWLLLGAALVALFTLLAVRALADGGPPETELPAASWTASAVIVPAPSSPPVPAETPAAETQPALESRYAPITGDDFELLARVVYAESNTESLEGQQAVAEVVLNRRAAENFPDTVRDVLYQPGQFATASMLERVTPTQSNYTAVWLALYGEPVLPVDVVYFSRGAENGNIWGRIGAHVFCYQYVWG